MPGHFTRAAVHAAAALALAALAMPAGACAWHRPFQRLGMAQKPVNPANDAARTPSEEKLDQVLLNAARMLKTKSKGDVDTYFRAHSLNPDADGRIPAQITATSQDALPALQDLALKHGATIQTTFENRLFVMLPAAAIMPLAERSDVWTINVERATSRPR